MSASPEALEDFWERTTSPSGRFRLGWRDAVELDKRMQRGRWRLVEVGRVRAEGEMPRPQDGRVIDDGTFILTDWIGWSGDLASVLHAFDASGMPLIAQRVGAIAATSALAEDGSVAVWQLLSNPNDRQWSDVLLCYDLEARDLRWSAHVPLRGDELLIDLAAGVVHIRNKDARELRVALADGSADPAEVRAIRLADPFDALEVIANEFATQSDPLDPQLASEWVRLLDEAISSRLSAYPHFAGRALRLEGEIADRLGDPVAALSRFEEALAQDPNVGIRRRADAMRTAGVAAMPREAYLELSPEAAEHSAATAQRLATRPVAPAVARVERPYASISCPHCGTDLRPPPKAKKACSDCHQPIYVRSGPDGKRHLLREADLTEFSKWWLRDAQERAAAEQAARRAEDEALGLLHGEYVPAVVGESHYQPALEVLAGGRGPGGARVEVIAELVREPANRYDRNAVRAVIGGQTVGYLAREDASAYQQLLRQFEREGRPARCRATIVGGWDDGPSRGSFGVQIEGLPEPE